MPYTLSYASRALIEPHSVDMLDIVRQSLRNNAANAVCGVLYFDQSQFFQVLEGDADGVQTIFRKILADQRHHDISVLHHGPIDHLRFGGTPMKFFDGSSDIRLTRDFSFECLRAASGQQLMNKIEALRCA